MQSGPSNPDRPSRANTQARVLIVSAAAERLEALTRSMRQDDLFCAVANTTDAALNLLLPRDSENGAGARYELVIYDLEKCSAAAMRFVRELTDLDVASILICPNVSFDDAVQAMRAGASDIISGCLKTKEMHKRVRSAIMQHRAATARGMVHDDGVPPLEDVDPEAARLAAPRHRPSQLIAGTVGKARKIKDLPPTAAPTPVELGSQFSTLIRGELDVECLLRHALEFVLAQAGPTNAAVFLPAASGDYSLGAYVNFSCSRDTVEVLLDHLANVAAPDLESTIGVMHMQNDAAMEEHIGHGTDWLTGHNALAFCCRHDGECLAIFLLFRERHSPFPPALVELCSELAARFGEQLARVVRIHHRHIPKDKWGKLGEPIDESDESGGMAA